MLDSKSERGSRAGRCAAVAIALALLFTAMLAGGAPARAEARGCAHAKQPASALGASQRSRALLCVINKTRKRHGARRLRRNPALQTAATAHSLLMVTLGCFAHECPGEQDLGTRLQRAGFPPCACTWRAAENIAYGERRRSAPKRIVRAWMHSPPHRAALLDPGFRLIGIGIALGSPKARLDRRAATYTIDLGRIGG